MREDKPVLLIHQSEKVQQDIVEIADYIDRQSPAAADRFLESCQKTFEKLATFPRMGRRVLFENPELKNLRKWRVGGFERYLIFYRVMDNRIEILRLIAAERDLKSLFKKPTRH